jgi:peptidyl-prolyl cis-trans isomerase A (cyclophilin A)
MRMKIKFLSLLLLVFAACKSPAYKNPHVVIETRLGNIELELEADKAPKTVQAFLAGIDSGRYRNTYFYRVLNVANQPSDAFKAELLQGGLWRNKRKLSAEAPRIPHEPTNETGIKHEAGTISMARLEPGSAGTEFFICITPQPGFDFGGENNEDKQGYAAFGHVVKGMEVAEKIYTERDTDQLLDPPVPIFNIRRL